MPIPPTRHDRTRAAGSWTPPTLQIAPGTTGRLRIATARAGETPRERLRMAEKRSLSEAVSRSIGRICNLFLRGQGWKPGGKDKMRGVIFVSMLLLFSIVFRPVCHAVDFNTITSIRLQNGIVTVEFSTDPGVYYLVEHSDDLAAWQAADMSLGAESVMQLAAGITKGFFRALPISKYAPKDTDGDGIDDVYELQNPGILDPLDPFDGSRLAPGGGGRTNYQVYLGLFGITSYKILQREGREVSIFNFGSPSATFEANTREQSVFNFGSPSATFEANSRELTLYNGAAVPISDLLQIETREVTLFNFGDPPGAGSNPPGSSGTPPIGYTNSREFSVFNGQAVPITDVLQIETREVSVFNFGSPSAPVETISREVSVLNFDEP